MLGSVTKTSISAVVADRLITPVYQPIVHLLSGEIVGYEALARGPVGTDLERPDALFAAADRAGLRAELDWVCRAVALNGALEAGLSRETCLFINLEPSTFGIAAPTHLVPQLVDAVSRLNVIAEITERDLAGDPAALLDGLAELRGLGFGIAIDDLGANPETLALLPFLEPDIIKLDMALIQSASADALATTAAAVRADAERRGTLILAEGIETEDHLHRASVLGADYGQGWLFSRPGPIERRSRDGGPPSKLWAKLVRDFHPTPATPWDLVAGSPDLQTAPKAELLSMSLLIEQYPFPANERPVILSAFQHARHFTPATVLRYAELAGRATFVGVVGEGLSIQPAPGVRGGAIDRDHQLSDEWTVVCVGPHHAAALIARDLGDRGPEEGRRFEYLVTHDRTTVIAAAASLLSFIRPASEHRRRSTDV